MVAWKTRANLGLDGFNGVGGVAGGTRPDNIIFDIVANTDLQPIPPNPPGTGQSPGGQGGVGTSPSGFGHPKCLNNPDPSTLPVVH
jgi:hypothetical protein